MSAELLPCPCGRPAYFHGNATIDKYVIACEDDDCYWSMTGYSKDALTVLWNRRAAAPEQPAAQGDGGLVRIVADIRKHCLPGNPESAEQVTTQRALSWARRIETALQRQPADAENHP